MTEGSKIRHTVQYVTQETDQTGRTRLRAHTFNIQWVETMN